VKALVESCRLEESIEALNELSQIVIEGLNRTQRLVADLRDFAAPSRGPAKSIDVRQCVESTMQLLKYSLRERGTSCRIHFPDERILVRGNSRELSQVLLNLVKNANESVVKHEGNIEISVISRDCDVEILIEDNGCGVCESEMEQLFQPFYTTKPSGRGTGLGLSISQRIVTEMGGRITVRSNPGTGSTFAVRFPKDVESRET